MYPPKIIAFTKAQMQFEGWYLPGQVVDGVTYPKGSLTYQSNNPCAIKFSKWQLAPIPDGLGCLGMAKNCSLGLYSDEESGRVAGCQFLLTVIQNEMIPYRNQAKLWHLPDSGSLSIAQYFSIYSSAKYDANHPVQYAQFVANAIGLKVGDQIKTLLQ